MKDSFKLFPIFTALILLVFPPVILQAQGTPVLFGKISLKDSRVIPMGGATVEIRQIVSGKPGKLLFKTYTDSRGNFAFYKIPPGKYFLIILQGMNAFYQLDRGRRDKKRMVIIGNPGSNRSLSITVVK